MSSYARLAFVDDHQLLREGLIQAVSLEVDMQVIGQGESAADALAIARDLQPDLILLDLDMPGDVIGALDAIAQISPQTRIAILTVSDDEDALMSALRHGVCGYILKGVSGRELVAILRSILAGHGYVPPALAAGLIGSLTVASSAPLARHSELDSLTAREHQILGFVADGLSNKEIGLQLRLTEKTIKYYMTAILDKLHVRSRVEAALLVDRLGGRSTKQAQ